MRLSREQAGLRQPPAPDEDEAVVAVTNTEFGLVAYGYTRDLRRALRVVKCLETGMVGLNQRMVFNPAAPSAGQALGLRTRARL